MNQILKEGKKYIFSDSYEFNYPTEEGIAELGDSLALMEDVEEFFSIVQGLLL